MSFNEKSGKTQERRFSLKWNRTDLHRRQVSIFEEKLYLKSQRETNIQSRINDEQSIKQDSRFMLPSIIRDKALQDTKTIQSKIQLKTRVFTEEKDNKDETSEQNLFTVTQNQKSVQKPKKNVVNPWYKKLRKKQQNIILNYLNTKIETQRGKKNKKKIKKSISNERILENKQFVIIPASSFQRCKKNLSEFKAQKLEKINLNQTIINRGQSLPNYKQKQLPITFNKNDKFGKQSEIIKNLKQKVRKMKQEQQSEEKKINVTQNLHLKNHWNFQQDVFDKSIVRKKRIKKLQHSKDLLFETLQQNTQQSQITNKYQSDDSIINQRFEHDKSRMSSQNNSKISDVIIQPVLQREILRDENLSAETLINLKKQIQKESISLKQTIKYQESNQNEISKEHTFKNESKCMKIPDHIPDKSFLQIKTFYAQIDQKVSYEKISPQIKCSSLKISFKKLPSSSQIVNFVEKYIPQNDQLKIPQLMKHQNFKVLLEQGKQLYFGLIENNKKSGLGVTIKEKYSFQGLYLEGQKMRGVQINQVGKYIGNFTKNKREGKGEFLWKNGQKYDGEWKNGKKHGKGTWSSPNGDLYEGEWIQGKVQGYGIHKSSNGNIFCQNLGQQYEGFFHEYLKSGQGKEILPNGDAYVGEFSKGKPHGKGKYTWYEGQIYEGDFSLGFRHGFGILSDKIGNIYKGQFNDEQASGKCEVNFSSQDFYKGYIQNGQFDGQGTLELYGQEQLWTGHWVLDEFVESLDSSES